jgi:hypothetical protein
MMRLQAALPTPGLSALASHSARSAVVAARAGIASRRAAQRSSPPDLHDAMLFSLRLVLRRGPNGHDHFSLNGRHFAIRNPGAVASRSVG